MGTGDDDRRQALAAELACIDAERDEALFELRLERRTRPPDEGPSGLRLRYEALEVRRREVRAELRSLDRTDPGPDRAPAPDRDSSPPGGENREQDGG